MEREREREKEGGEREIEKYPPSSPKSSSSSSSCLTYPAQEGSLFITSLYPYQHQGGTNIYPFKCTARNEVIMVAELLSIQPGELKFQFELRKQISCSVQLVNTTQSYVAFKVKTTSPRKYCVRPNSGVISPGATCDVTVVMQAQREAPPDMQCKDKFLVQSVVLSDDGDHKDISQELFNKAPGREIFESKLRVMYVQPQPPSPVAESAEEGISPTPSFSLENGYDLGKDGSNLKVKLAETRAQILKLTEEKNAAIQKNMQLQFELGKLPGVKRNLSMQGRNLESGFSLLFVIVVGLIGLAIGYFLRS